MENGEDARDELVRSDRLDDVVIGTEQKARDAVERLGAFPRDEDDGETLVDLLLEAPAELVPGEIGEVNVDQCEPGTFLAGRGECCTAGRRRLRRVAQGSERLTDEQQEFLVVVNDEERAAG